MGDFWYTYAKARQLSGDLDLDADALTVMLVMTNTTCHTEKNVQTVGAFTTKDEMDGSGYSRKTLADLAVTADEINLRGEFDASDLLWASLGAGSRDVKGALLLEYVDGGDGDRPIAYIDSGGFPLPATGEDFTVEWNVEGILHLT